jgi:hypothetical protein
MRLLTCGATRDDHTGFLKLCPTLIGEGPVYERIIPTKYLLIYLD